MSNADELLANRAPWAVINDDCVRGMKTLPDGCVHCCATSPPYFALRDYGHEGQIGLEESPSAYVAKMVEVFREVRRILHPSGVTFLNLGDSYAANQGGAQGATSQRKGCSNVGEQLSAGVSCGFKPKDLIGIPWRVAFALQADGWYLRQDIIWHKPNPMPSSVTDRCTTAHEYVFLLAKEGRYFFDAQAIAEQADLARAGQVERTFHSPNREGAGRNDVGREVLRTDTRNKRSVWKVATRSYKGAHFATWPPKLVEPMILAGTSAKGVCPHCGEPWRRVVKKVRRATRPALSGKMIERAAMKDEAAPEGMNGLYTGNRDPERHVTATETVGWEQRCKCPAHEPVPAVVFDPFTGSGTTLAVAVDHGRRGLGTELNPDYLPLIRERMAKAQPPLFAEVS